MRWGEDSGPGRGVQLHLLSIVDPTAPPVLLLHGLGVGGSVWQAFARRLLPYLAAVAPDLRGHGKSDAPPTGYTAADYAGDLIVLIQDRFQSPVPVVGHSLGSLVGLKLAELRPDLVRWLVLLDPPLDAKLRNPEVESVYHLRHAPAGDLEAYLLSRNPGGGKLLAAGLATLFRQASDGAYEAMLADRVQPDVQGRRDSGPPSLLEHAAAVRVPVLLVQADPDHGGVLGDVAARAFVDRLPNGRLLKIAGATHALHASRPAEVARAILEFGGYSSDGSSDGSSSL